MVCWRTRLRIASVQTVTDDVYVSIRIEGDIVTARHLARALATPLGFSPLMDEFAITSEVGRGTTVSAKRWAPTWD